MQFHILVTPIPDEPLVLTRRQALDGLGWLNGHLASGELVDAWAFPQTGGAMIVEAPFDDEAEARAWLDELLCTYPLLGTVNLRINRMVTLAAGFDVLLSAIDEHRRISA